MSLRNLLLELGHPIHRVVTFGRRDLSLFQLLLERRQRGLVTGLDLLVLRGCCPFGPWGLRLG